MGKISLIIQREYLTRVKKMSFIIMTLVGPILLGAMMIVPAWLATQQDGRQDIIVVDESEHFKDFLANTEDVQFFYTPTYRINSDMLPKKDSIFKAALAQAEQDMLDGKYSAVLHILPGVIEKKHNPTLIYKKQIGVSTKYYIQRVLQDNLEDIMLLMKGINVNDMRSAKQSAEIKVKTKKINNDGEAENDLAESSLIAGYIAGFLVYIFIFLFGAQVMRGVIEEKVSRIVEVIISSVKPVQLMMGKIIGIALVGLTQFLLWVVLTAGIVTVASSFLINEVKKPAAAPPGMEELMGGNKSASPANPLQSSPDEMDIAFAGLAQITANLPLILGAFLFYFLGGYLLYASLFAAVGSAVDSEADTQQFMLPITVPLIFSFAMVSVVVNNPEGPLAFWLSIIPFTSPIIMMVRIPFGMEGHWWELWLSMGLLVLGFVCTTWFAARIYRVGILMYGKKPSFKELGKWLFYKG